MKNKINLINYLPEFLRDIREYKALATVEDDEISCLWEGVEEAFDNQTVDTANEYGISRLEKIMNINPEGSDIDERKTEIKTRLGQKLPYTEHTLINALDEFCGPRKSIDNEILEGYKLDISIKDHTLNVLISLWNKNKKDLLYKMIRQMCPANMVCSVELKYNTYGDIQKLNLSYGQLSQLTYKQIREDVLEDVIYIIYENLSNLNLTHEDISKLTYEEIGSNMKGFMDSINAE